jgi:hypothetical protein
MHRTCHPSETSFPTMLSDDRLNGVSLTIGTATYLGYFDDFDNYQKTT